MYSILFLRTNTLPGKFYREHYNLNYDILGFKLPNTINHPIVDTINIDRNILAYKDANIVFLFDLVFCRTPSWYKENTSVENLVKYTIIDNINSKSLIMIENSDNIFRERIAFIISDKFSHTTDLCPGLIKNLNPINFLYQHPLTYSSEYQLYSKDIVIDINLIEEENQVLRYFRIKQQDIKDNRQFLEPQKKDYENLLLNIMNLFENPELTVKDNLIIQLDILLDIYKNYPDANQQYIQKCQDIREKSIICKTTIISCRSNVVSMPYTISVINSDHPREKILIPSKNSSHILEKLTRQQLIELLIYLNNLPDKRFDDVRLNVCKILSFDQSE